MAVAGHYAYLARRFGFHVIDITQPTTLVDLDIIEEIGDIQFPMVEDMTVAGDRLYVTLIGEGLYIFDISSPAHPVEIGFFPSGSAEDIVLRKGTIYVSYGLAGLYLFQVLP